MKSLLESCTDQKRELEHHSDNIEDFNKEISKVNKEQRLFKENLINQNNLIENNYSDFEDHKKVIEHLVQENCDIQNEFLTLKTVDIAAIKQHMLFHSAMTNNTSAPPSYSFGAGPSHDHDTMKIEKSLDSRDFNFNPGRDHDAESDNGLIYKNSEINDFDNINDCESNNNEPSLVVNRDTVEVLDAESQSNSSFHSERIVRDPTERKSLGHTHGSNLVQSQTMSTFKKVDDLRRGDTLDSIPEELKSVRVSTKSSQLMDLIKNVKKDKSASLEKENYINKLTTKTGLSFEANENLWMQNSNSWMMLPVTYNHRLKHQYMIQRMAMTVFKENKFPGYSYQYQDISRINTESTHETDQLKAMHHSHNRSIRETNREGYSSSLLS